MGAEDSEWERVVRMGRRLPRWAEVRDLVGVPAVDLNATRRRLAGAHTIGDLRRIARARTPRAVFDYVDGGAERELGLRALYRQWRRVRFHPRVCRDVSAVDAGIELFGRGNALPLVLAPTGFTRMMHHEGERAVAAAAERAGLAYAVSTLGTTAVGDVVAAAPQGRTWFQLYVSRDRERSRELVAAAARAGCDTLVLTVDAVVAGARLRDVRNGFTVPPRVRPAALLDMAVHPRWWFNVLTTEPLRFASLAGGAASPAEVAGAMFDPGVTFDDVAWLRRQWRGTLLVKGVQTVEDACAAVDRGADGVVLSNHGARQLDRAVEPLSLVGPVSAAVGGRASVLVDGGITSGADVVAAVAAGADACLVGRAYLYGLMAGGRAGVDRALEILRGEVVRTMKLLGAVSVAELTPDMVSLDGQA